MKTKRFRKSLPAAGVLVVLASAPAQSAVVWHFNYLDPAGVGFNDATEGTARQQALQDAATYISSFLTAYDANLYIDVDGSASGGTLASAGSEVHPTPAEQLPGFNIKGDIQKKILGGDSADPLPQDASSFVPGTANPNKDGTVSWNWNIPWELASDFQAGEFDFISTARHELLHALGFSASVNQDGSNIPGQGPDIPVPWGPFDQFLADANGRLIDNTYAMNGTRWAAASVDGLASGASSGGCAADGHPGLLFDGPNAKAANGGNPIELYSPSSWEDGSSGGSHIDDQCYGGTYIMEAATEPGLSTRTISPVEIGIMRDIGYTQFGQQSSGGGGGAGGGAGGGGAGGGGGSAAVPAAPIGSLLLAGLGLLGIGRRRQSRA